MTSPLLLFPFGAPMKAGMAWEPLIPAAPEHYSGQWIGDHPNAHLVAVPGDTSADRTLVKAYHNALRGRIVTLKSEYETLEYACALETQADLRSLMALAMDSADYNGIRLELAACQMMLGGRIMAMQSWGLHEREDVRGRGERGELMARPWFEKVLNYAVAKEALQYQGNSLTVLETGKSVTLGRTEDNDLVLPHPQVSGNHAVVSLVRTPSGIAISIEDKGSINGVCVGERRLPLGQSMVVGYGESFRVGSCRIQNRIPKDADLSISNLRLEQASPDAPVWVLTV